MTKNNKKTDIEFFVDISPAANNLEEAQEAANNLTEFLNKNIVPLINLQIEIKKQHNEISDWETMKSYYEKYDPQYKYLLQHGFKEELENFGLNLFQK